MLVRTNAPAPLVIWFTETTSAPGAFVNLVYITFTGLEKQIIKNETASVCETITCLSPCSPNTHY